MSRTIIGLTGSIGMGKSTTAQMFAELGIPVWDADAAVHRIYAADGAGGPALAQLIPNAVDAEGAVSRDMLKAAIAANPALLTKIEQRIHPLVAQDRAAFLDAHEVDDIVLLDIPLLFETNGTAMVDRVAVVSTTADESTPPRSCTTGMDDDTFERLLARQMPDAEKRARADFVIRTDDLATARQGRGRLAAHTSSRGKHA
jgi:dephospho-CoA kinase